MKIFVILVILTLPVALIYYYSNPGELSFERLSIGNLGFSDNKCFSQINYLKGQKQYLQCYSGKMSSDGPKFYGLIPSGPVMLKGNLKEVIHRDYCGNHTLIRGNNVCDLDYDRKILNDTYM